MKSFFRPSVSALWFLALLAPGFAPRARADEATLQSVVIVSRHGVRAPVDAPEKLAPYTAQPWPHWDVPPGYLTPRGKQLVTLMGAYYRARYVAAGLLTGRAAEDQARVFFRANNMERTQETARGLALGLVGDAQPDVHALPDGQVDVMFIPAKVRFGHPDDALASAAVRARMGRDPDVFIQGYRPQFEQLQQVLFGPDHGTPPGKKPLLSLPLIVRPGEGNDFIDTSGPLELAKTFTENFMLEYEQGFPAADVGWGRVTRASLDNLLQLHALAFDLTQRTFYVAQVQASNMASHVLQTLAQAAAGHAVPGAIGPPSSRIVVLAGHDTNLASLAGLLNLSWSMDRMPMSPVLPGGALVFELWRHADGAFFVRTYYMAQTLDQLRAAQVLTLQSPPAVTPVFVPGCSTTGPDYEAPFARFAACLQQAIDPQFVAP